MKIKAIITGATGMVGEGVLYECINNEEVEKILVIGRKPCGYSDSKLKEVIHKDFFDLSPIRSELEGYDACFFCLGVSSLGMKEDEYTHLTYNLTMNLAKTLSELNPGMTFCYISGAGTDSTEKGKTMWARVKGRTENDLKKLPFRQVYNFRPAFIRTFLPVRPTQAYYRTYKSVQWMFPAIKLLFPGSVSELKNIARAMINVTLKGYGKSILEVRDINNAASL
jgi:hypothetical protein